MWRLVSLFIVAVLAMPSAAWCQAFPSRPIRIVVPYSVGGPTDIAARAIAQEIQKLLGQPVIVENKPGASGNIGGAEVARAAPDGYTLLLLTNGLNLNPLLSAGMSFDPIKDFAPIAPLVSFANVLVVSASSPVKSVQELVAMARSRPGGLTFGSGGNATMMHLSAEMLRWMTDIPLVHIPYKGAAPATVALMGGEVDFVFNNIPPTVPHIKSGRLRPLAVTGDERSQLFPEVPTMVESGLKGYRAVAFSALVAPAGTPKEIISTLNAAVVKGAQSKEFRERADALGFEVIPGSAEKLAAMLRDDIDRWRPVIKAIGVKFD